MEGPSEEANEAALDTEDSETTFELQDAFELQKVRDIRRNRQPYMPVAALPPGEGSGMAAMPAAQGAIQPTFKYDSKGCGKYEPKKGGRQKREEEAVNLISSQVITEFSYMASTEKEGSYTTPDLQVFLASIPLGCAVIDTGCTSSVIGSESAARVSESLTHSPVQLPGFNGAKTTKRQGLRWTVKLGALWGQITTHVMPGEAPFLLSRCVLQNMGANLDVGNLTISGEKHKIHRWSGPSVQCAPL